MRGGEGGGGLKEEEREEARVRGVMRGNSYLKTTFF